VTSGIARGCAVHRAHRHAAAALLVALGLARGLPSAGVPPAAAGVPPPAVSPRAAGEADSLGSAAHPYPLGTFEARASRRGRAGPIDQFVVRVGPLRAVLQGVPEAAVAAGGARTAGGADSWGPRWDLYSGAGLELLDERFGGVFADGGRQLLRDPLEIPQLGSVEGEEWTGTAGIELRF